MDELIDKSILSNFDIIKISQLLNIKLDAILMNDQFKDKMLDYDFSIIINFENTNEGGSHWVAMHCEPSIKTVYYMDSFGEVPNAKIYNIIVKRGYKLLFNKEAFQALESQLCGWFSLYMLYCLQKTKKKDKTDAMVKYLNLFTKEVRFLDNNDKKIKQLFIKLMNKKKV